MGYELRDCVKADNGKLYCYDCEIKQVVEISTIPRQLKELPEDVLRAMLLSKYDNAICLPRPRPRDPDRN